MKRSPLWLQRLWKLWFSSLAILFIVRFVFLNQADENTRFLVFVPFPMIFWLACIFINMYMGFRLDNYLRRHHRQSRHVWGGLGPLGLIRKLRFLHSAEDLGDSEVGRLKFEYRAFLKLMLTIFCTFPFLFIAFMIGAKTN
ncbi:MAG TPA: hypothetical protein VF681_06620 [Abditibacteriaceae bacterium]|jgi:hypothetical protein